MEKLEKIIKNEFVFYSCSQPPKIEEPKLDFDSIISYAENLNKQFGIQSSNVEPTIPSKSSDVSDFDLQGIIYSLNNSYESSLNQEQIDYANNLAQPSSSVHPQISSSFISPKNFSPDNLNLTQIVSSENSQKTNQKAFQIPSLYSQPDSPIYYKPQKQDSFKKPDQNYFYTKFSQKNHLRSEGLKDKKPILDLFKNNSLPQIYNQVYKGLNLKKGAVKTITFTNPLKDKEEYSPSFEPIKKDLRLPVLKPKSIFKDLSQQSYQYMLKNAFLPHELGHAKIEQDFPNIPTSSPGLKGFNEHLSDQLALHSLKGTLQSAKTYSQLVKFHKQWSEPQGCFNWSNTKDDYLRFLNSEKDYSFLLGKQATVNMLGNNLVKKNFDSALKDILELKYGYDPHKETVFKEIESLSGFYQDTSLKMLKLINKNTFSSKIIGKKLWESVEKKTIKFQEVL